MMTRRWAFALAAVCVSACAGTEIGTPLQDPPTDEGRRPTLAPIDWRSAAQARPLLSQPPAEAVAAELSAGTLPVLLPDSAVLIGAIAASSDTGWYAASMPADGHSVLVTGSRLAFAEPGVPLSGQLSVEGELTRTDGIVELSFVAFGAAYSVEVECDRPFDDARCSGDDYIREVVGNLALLSTEEG